MIYIRRNLTKTFDYLRRILGRPVVYVIPWQRPSGLTYSNDVDAWVDGDGAVVTKTPAQLTYYEVPALWGADAAAFELLLGGRASSGELAAIARATYAGYFNGAMMIVTGSLTGEKYHVVEVEDAPDGMASPTFVVARLNRMEE